MPSTNMPGTPKEQRAMDIVANMNLRAIIMVPTEPQEGDDDTMRALKDRQREVYAELLPKIELAMVEAMRTKLTVEDLEAMEAFYSDPGRIARYMEVMTDLGNIMQEVMQGRLRRLYRDDDIGGGQ